MDLSLTEVLASHWLTYTHQDRISLIWVNWNKVTRNDLDGVIVDREDPCCVNRCVDESQKVLSSLRRV
jgi:hypothetical protein